MFAKRAARFARTYCDNPAASLKARGFCAKTVYASSLERLLNWCGAVKVIRIDPLQLHLNEPNRPYANRDFAVLDVTWEDQAGLGHTFKERWVRDRSGKWYTRCTGLVTPDEP